jgi:uncharacterized coiled-coil protein SlyX
MSDKLGFVEIAVAVLISVTASWVYVKEDIAEAKARIEFLERNQERDAEVLDKFSDSLNELNGVLREMKVELRYLRKEGESN